MLSTMLVIGCMIFGASVFLVLALPVVSGGANKARQFKVLGDLLSGRQGALKRRLLIAAFCGLAVGAAIAFTAVARADAVQRQQCRDICAARGFKEGTIGLSSTPQASGRPFKICRCTGGPEKDQEIDLDELPE